MKPHVLNIIALLERDGWCQHTHKNEKGERCIQGAINEAVPPLLWKEVERIIERELGIGIMFFNDMPGRTKRHVISKLKSCAEKL